MPLTPGQEPLYACLNHQQSLVPGTLPDGTQPLVYADFKNAVYQIASSDAAITDIFEENTDYGAYAPSDVVAGVGLVASQGPVLKAALAAGPLADGYTVVFEAVFSETSNNQFYSIDAPNWGQELSGGLAYDNGADKLFAVIQGVHGNQAGPFNINYPARYKVGASIDGTDIAMSVAGTAVLNLTGGPASTLDTIAIYANNSVDTPYENWALYPLQDPSSLDELTAP